VTKILMRGSEADRQLARDNILSIFVGAALEMTAARGGFEALQCMTDKGWVEKHLTPIEKRWGVNISLDFRNSVIRIIGKEPEKTHAYRQLEALVDGLALEKLSIGNRRVRGALLRPRTVQSRPSSRQTGRQSAAEPNIPHLEDLQQQHGVQIVFLPARWAEGGEARFRIFGEEAKVRAVKDLLVRMDQEAADDRAAAPSLLSRRQGTRVPLPECPICLCEVEEKEAGLRLFCGHTYHQECLANQIQQAKEGQLPVVCHHDGCGKPISLPEIRRALKGDREQIESFFKAASQHYINTNSNTRFGVCLTTDCPQIYSLEDKDTKPIFRCNVCKSILCKKCGTPHDETLTCQEFKVDPTGVSKYLATVQSGGRLCPKCGTGIERSEGCKYVRCRCGTELCILCGHVCRTSHEEHSCRESGFAFLNR